MKATLLIFLYLLTIAETTRKFISHDIRPPRDYLEEENEDDDDDDDDDENTNVEQSSETERTSVSQTDDGVDLLEKTMQNLQEKAQFTSTKEEEEEEEEERSQEEEELESRLGPHYLTTFVESHSEELPFQVSYKADLPERNGAQENKEYCKVHVVLVTSSVTFGVIYFFLVCCWMVVMRHRLK